MALPMIERTQEFRQGDPIEAAVQYGGKLSMEAVVTSVADPELAWQERALCAQTDPEAFFPERGGSNKDAKKVCVSCEVRSDCLDYALSHDERFGIWGGLSERERRRLTKEASANG